MKPLFFLMILSFGLTACSTKPPQPYGKYFPINPLKENKLEMRDEQPEPSVSPTETVSKSRKFKSYAKR